MQSVHSPPVSDRFSRYRRYGLRRTVASRKPHGEERGGPGADRTCGSHINIQSRTNTGVVGCSCAGVAHSLHGDLSALKLLDCENGYAQHRELRRLALPAQLLLNLEDLHIHLHLHLVDLDTARGKPDA